MNKGKLLLGFLAGIATGAVLGILFAPGKGSSTRKKISQKSDDYLKEMEEKFDELVDGVTRKYNNVKEDASQMVEDGKKKVEEVERRIIAGVK